MDDRLIILYFVNNKFCEQLLSRKSSIFRISWAHFDNETFAFGEYIAKILYRKHLIDVSVTVISPTVHLSIYLNMCAIVCDQSVPHGVREQI